MQQRENTPTLLGIRVLFIVCEYPTSGTAGYHTYNRQILTSLLEAGAHVHLAALSTRTQKLIEKTPKNSYHDNLEISGRGILKTGKFIFLAAHPRGFFGWLSRALKRITKPKSPTKKNTAIIGRHATAQDGIYISKIACAWKPDIAILDTIFSPTALVRDKNIPTIIVTHDVFHQRTRSLTNAGLQPTPFIDLATERELLSGADGLIAISEHDAAEFKSLHPGAVISVVTPPIEKIETPLNPHIDRDEPCIFYLGSAANHNIQAMQWFLAHAWPHIRLRHPSMKLRVAGDVGAHLPLTPGVQFLGRVSSPSAAAKGCFAAIDPVQAGSGVKIKITTYLALGLQCITTEHGAKGLEEYLPHLRLADTAEEFSSAIDEALKSCANGTITVPPPNGKPGKEALSKQISIILQGKHSGQNPQHLKHQN